MSAIEFCAIKGCGRRAVGRPTILLWASPKKDHPPAQIKFKDLGLCHGCQAEGKFETVYLGDQKGRAEISMCILAQGKAAPDWSTVSVRWHPIQGNDAPEFSSGAEGYQPI
jgi:hypothetical protein